MLLFTAFPVFRRRCMTLVMGLILQTIESLVAASNLPLSVVIVGIGHADFSVSHLFASF